jgi:hypothetical protein
MHDQSWSGTVHIGMLKGRPSKGIESQPSRGLSVFSSRMIDNFRPELCKATVFGSVTKKAFGGALHVVRQQ